jgi:hypothetical protein
VERPAESGRLMPHMDYKLCRYRWGFDDFTRMFGMNEIEAGMAVILNKAEDHSLTLEQVTFTAADFKDHWEFRELQGHGWLDIASNGEYKLCAEAIARIRKRHPKA